MQEAAEVANGPPLAGSADAEAATTFRKSLTLADFGDKKATCRTWRKAEGTGLEPATPYGALHFQ